MNLANCENIKIHFLLDPSCRSDVRRVGTVTLSLCPSDKLCAINWFTASLALSVPQESAFGPELYFDVLGEVLTYLDKGLNLAGCPAAGMDKHGGGVFDIQAPVSEGTAVDTTQSGRNSGAGVQLTANKQRV